MMKLCFHRRNTTPTIMVILAALVYVASTTTTPTAKVAALQQLNHIHTIAHSTGTHTATSRRDWFQSQLVMIGTTTAATLVLQPPLMANGAEFAPGGTLITDKEIGILVNNPNASPIRKYDNSNVLFDKDYYYKFGTGIQYIEPPGNTSFPKTMPFTKSQQRYDSMKKYRERIVGSLQLLQSLPKTTTSIADPKNKEDVYQLRAMGLLANGLLASENNGLPNELFVARYYINEIYLRLIELSSITTDDKKEQQQQIYSAIEKATNSYLTLMNRAITAKVGEPFPYITLV